MLSVFVKQIANRLSSEMTLVRRTNSATAHRSPARSIGLESLEQRALLSATTMEVEPNNNAAAATIAPFDPADRAAQLIGSIADRKDRDFFRFTATASGSVQLAAHGAPGLVPKVEVETSRSREVFETEPHNGVSAGSFAVEAGQTYTLRVEGKDKTIGAYAVDLVFSDTTPPVTGGADDPANHDVGDDHGQRHGGHGADDPAIHNAGDDRSAVAPVTTATKGDDHGSNRQSDRGHLADDASHEDRQLDRHRN